MEDHQWELLILFKRLSKLNLQVVFLHHIFVEGALPQYDLLLIFFFFLFSLSFSFFYLLFSLIILLTHQFFALQLNFCIPALTCSIIAFFSKIGSTLLCKFFSLSKPANIYKYVSSSFIQFLYFISLEQFMTLVSGYVQRLELCTGFLHCYFKIHHILYFRLLFQ